MQLTREQECQQIVQTISALPESTLQKLNLPAPPAGASITPAQICANKMGRVGLNVKAHTQFVKAMKNSPAVGKNIQESAEESVETSVA